MGKARKQIEKIKKALFEMYDSETITYSATLVKVQEILGMSHEHYLSHKETVRKLAWQLLTAKMAGSIHQYDHWEDVPQNVKDIYLKHAEIQLDPNVDPIIQ